MRNLLSAGILRRGDTLDGHRERYITHLRETAAGRGGNGKLSLVDERAKLAREQAEYTRLRAAVIRGAMIPTDLAIKLVQGAFVIVRQRLLMLHHKVQARCPDATLGVLAEIESQVREALEELSDTEMPESLRALAKNYRVAESVEGD